MESIARTPQMLLTSLHEMPWLWAWGGVLVLVLLAVALRYRRTRQARTLRRAIRALGTKVMADVLVPDSVEGRIHADFLVLSGRRILVVDVKDYRGMLFGGQNTDVWTQVVDGRSYKFDNPLYRNRAREAAVRALVPEADVQGVVVFTDAGRFPRQLPAGVFMLAELAKELAASDVAVPPNLQASWDRLEQRVMRSA